MLSVTVIRPVSLKNSGLIALQISEQISVPGFFDLFVCYIGLNHPPSQIIISSRLAAFSANRIVMIGLELIMIVHDDRRIEKRCKSIRLSVADF